MLNIIHLLFISCCLFLVSNFSLAGKGSKEGEKGLTLEDLGETVQQIVEANHNSSKKKKKYDKVSIHDLDEWMITKISPKLYTIIENFDDKDNSVLQTALNQLQQKTENLMLKKLPEYGQSNRTEEQNKAHFARIWKESINKIFEIETKSNEEGEENNNLDIIEFSDEESVENEEGKKEDQEKNKKISVKTTLLNILLRKKDSIELAEKVQTLIENGANKNLHQEFDNSPKMENQKEFPLSIVLNEIKDAQLRNKILMILANDNISYCYNELLEETEKMNNLIISVSPNKNFILERLIEEEDFPTFNLVLDYLEKSVVFITESYTDKIAQIDDQIHCPILEKVLSNMMKVRRKSVSSDENGIDVDNINDFFTTKKLSTQMSVNHDARFSLHFQNRLSKDFESLFKKVAKRIDATRTESQLQGDELKPFIIEWTKWANFRNRVAKHLNKFALSASNEGNKSNVIKLIRYANIYDKTDIASEQDELFCELHAFGGADIIFTTRNKLKWTPLMYAMFQKQSEGIQLYLRQAPHEITKQDGVDNNLLHLAFPLPDKYFKQETSSQSDNVLDLVGANVGIAGAKEKTFEAIRAIITERSIPVEDKVLALNQLSASNFTPVSLAAATGYTEVYEFLVRFLKANNSWNEDDHSHLGTHTKELVVKGLQSYKASRERHDNLSSHEDSQISSEIEQRQRQIQQDTSDCIREIYHPESYQSTQFLKVIRTPMMKVLDEFYNQKGTKRKVAPYSEALETAMQEILNPKPIIEKIRLPDLPVLKVPEKTDNKKKKWKIIRAVFKARGRQVEEEPIPVQVSEPRYREESKPSLISGMRLATSSVKSSYLAPLVKEVTELYLRDHVSPQLMSFDAVYKGLTGNESKEFFQNNFNPTIEKKMASIILSTLKKSGRLREESHDEEDNKNRFDKLDNFHSSQSSTDSNSSESQNSDSDESNSDDEFGL